MTTVLISTPKKVGRTTQGPFLLQTVGGMSPQSTHGSTPWQRDPRSSKSRHRNEIPNSVYACIWIMDHTRSYVGYCRHYIQGSPSCSYQESSLIVLKPSVKSWLKKTRKKLQCGPKNRIPSFIFWITSVIQHRFWPFFHCYKQKFMARKREVLPPTTPLLCDHITLQTKHYC